MLELRPFLCEGPDSLFSYRIILRSQARRVRVETQIFKPPPPAVTHADLTERPRTVSPDAGLVHIVQIVNAAACDCCSEIMDHPPIGSDLAPGDDFRSLNQK
ncbi:hypothetical protein EVAR_85845_1 [Eumeta japonica]|uniref:Uncharacterized protein n=1 Tax=Eumeta variegata TaxID=151549 RepID=A0A4C1URP6_EUMVA|nr:hypothetical protein EVAR_85845_1 [Eumeta japonica]